MTFTASRTTPTTSNASPPRARTLLLASSSSVLTTLSALVSATRILVARRVSSDACHVLIDEWVCS